MPQLGIDGPPEEFTAHSTVLRQVTRLDDAGWENRADATTKDTKSTKGSKNETPHFVFVLFVSFVVSEPLDWSGCLSNWGEFLGHGQSIVRCGTRTSTTRGAAEQNEYLNHVGQYHGPQPAHRSACHGHQRQRGTNPGRRRGVEPEHKDQ